MSTIEPHASPATVPSWPKVSAALLLPVFFLGTAFVWKMVNDIFLAIIMVVVIPLASGANIPMTPDASLEWMRGDLSGIGFFTGMLPPVLFGVLLASRLGWSRSATFGLRRSTRTALIAACLGGWIVGFFPGWISERLVDYLPSLSSNALEIIMRLLNEGPVLSRALMAISVCIGAPILEELIFRGFLWESVRRGVAAFLSAVAPGRQAKWLTQNLPSLVTWITTSVLFAAFHLDPVQGTSLLFTAFFLGWLRWMSGSLWPCIIAHAINNGLATGLVWMTPLLGDVETPSWFVLGAASGTILLSLMCIPWRAREP